MFETIKQVTKTFGGKFTTNHLDAPLNGLENINLIKRMAVKMLQ